jgi:hypothetical protein
VDSSAEDEAADFSGPSSSRKRREAPPRIVLRFGLYTGIALVLAAVLVIFLVRHFTIEQAERSATDRARYVTQFALGDRLDPRDFAEPTPNVRTAALDQLFERLVLVDGTIAAELVGRDGFITYSTRHARIGTRLERSEDVSEVLTGKSLGRVSTADITVEGVRSEREVFVSLLPHGFTNQSEAGVLSCIRTTRRSQGPREAPSSQSQVSSRSW